MSALKDEVNKIIKNIKRGNVAAIKDLHDATYLHLRLVARNYLADTADTDDVLSEAYFKIYRYIHSADTGRDGYNWICKIVQNLCYDYNKKRGVCDYQDRLSQNNLFYDVEDELLDKSQLYVIFRKLDVLDQRILYLKFWEGYSLQEIARITDMKKSCVFKRLKTILRDLRKELQ